MSKLLNEPAFKVSKSAKRSKILGVHEEEHGIDESTFILGNLHSATNDEHNENNDDAETDMFHKCNICESDGDKNFDTSEDNITELD